MLNTLIQKKKIVIDKTGNEKEGQGNSEVETLTNDVTINVITTNKKELKSQNKLLKITPSGNFNGDWPEEFFEERFVELGID